MFSYKEILNIRKKGHYLPIPTNTSIKDQTEKRLLFSKMLRIGKPSVAFDDPSRIFDVFFSWIVGWKWTRSDLDIPIPEIFSDYYHEIHGRWNHSKNHNKNAHYILGTSFTYWAKYYCGFDIILADRPDIQGKIGNNNIWGDIGMVGMPTFWDIIRSFKRGDLWISVINSSVEILVECPYDFWKHIANHHIWNEQETKKFWTEQKQKYGIGI